MEKGVEKGIETVQIETCKRLLLAGSDVEFTAKITQLSIKRIKEIESEIEKQKTAG